MTTATKRSGAAVTCPRQLSLLDAAERILRAQMRGQRDIQGAADRWVSERERCGECATCPVLCQAVEGIRHE